MPPATDEPQDDHNSDKQEHLRAGKCRADSCGLEAGCLQRGENYHVCVCPQEGRPTKDLRCSRSTVTDGPKPFAVIPHSDSSQFNQSYSLTGEVWTDLSGLVHSHGLMILVAVLVFLCLSLLSFFCYRRRLRRTRKSTAIPMQTSPVSLSKGVIDADCFAANPGYLGSEPFPMVSHDSIIFHNSIGEGCFGKVYKGELRRPNGTLETVAIKVLKDSASKEAEDDFMREVEIMTSFQHENILALLGVAVKESGKNPCMVFEFMPYGDLVEVLRSNAKPGWKMDPLTPILDKESLLSIAQQIACGMKYLAAQHFVHRDLACRNCLVGNNLTVKIADFGMSRDVYTCDYYKIGGSRLLPVRWMSPESVTYGRFTLESDVWSFGVVLWEIYSLGKQPYYGHSNEEVIKLINNGIILIPPEDCPLVISSLMRSCWETEPKERPTFDEIYGRLERAWELPQPPPFTVTIPSVVLPEIEEYLCPTPRPPHHYLQPLPD